MSAFSYRGAFELPLLAECFGLLDVQPHPSDPRGQVCSFACGCRLANFPTHQLLSVRPGHGHAMALDGFIGQRDCDKTGESQNHCDNCRKHFPTGGAHFFTCACGLRVCRWCTYSRPYSHGVASPSRCAKCEMLAPRPQPTPKPTPAQRFATIANGIVVPVGRGR